MSWLAVLTIAGGAFFFKALGMFGGGRLMTNPRAAALGALLPPALLAALVMVQTFTTGSELVLDARAAGVGAGAFAVWRGAPFWLVVTIAAVITGSIRAVA